MTVSPQAPSPAEGAAPPQDELLSAIGRLETAVRRLRGAGGSSTEAAERLCRLEAEAVALAARAAQQEPEEGGGPSRRAVLAELLAWSELADHLDLPEAAGAARAAARRLLDEEIRRWAAEAEGRAGAPADCFEALLGSLVLELDAVATFPEDPGDLRPLEDVKRRLRERLLKLLEAAPVDRALRERWSVVLADRADVVLRMIDHLPPEAGGRLLEATADQLRWHVQEVERDSGPARRRLRRKRAQLETEYEERTLQHRMERRFGRRGAAWIERLVLALILAVLGLLALEGLAELTPRQLAWLHGADTAICVVFLWEFFTKLRLAPRRARWFWRHVAIDFIPSIPFGLVLGVYGADAVRAGRAARLLRLPRLARYVRILRPAVRLLRAVGFLLRGVDRLVRLYGPLLNRDILLYPTREERMRAHASRRGPLARLHAVQAELDHQWRALLLGAPQEERATISLTRTRLLESLPAARSAPAAAGGAGAAGSRGEVLFEDLWRRLGSLTPQHVKSLLPPDLSARLARIARLFASAPVCWLPLIRAYAPRVGPHMAPADVVAAAAHRLASALKRYYERSYWAADLYGVITPPQFIDRLGAVLVKNTARPAYRLAVFGGFFVITEVLLHVANLRALAPAEAFLERYVGPTLVLLGGICLVVMGLGWWLQQLAKEATDYLEKVVEAQFLALTELIRAKRLERDAAVLHRRVLEPEYAVEQVGTSGRVGRAAFIEQVRRVLAGGHESGKTARAFDPTERVLLLHRDSLDGALLCTSDNRTTTQLLGNIALRRLLLDSWRAGRRELARLRRLDLERQRRLFGGPYLWFNLIARAAAQGAARLVLDYNRHAIPLAELPLASPDEREARRRWLERREPPKGATADELKRLQLATTAFTALHFLDCEPHRDREVARRFGHDVLDRLQNDRRLLIRRVFGAFPFHRLPRDRRCINVYRFYQQWLAGGRVLLAPWRLAVIGLRRLARLAAWTVRAVQEIRHPDRRTEAVEAAEADFLTAVRKIDRMRRPVVEAALTFRSRMDPEYLGAALPTQPRPTLGDHDLDADLEFLLLDPELVDALQRERRRAEADMRRLDRLIRDGLLIRVARRLGADPAVVGTLEHVRAAAVAYLADLRGVRSLLSAEDILREVCEAAPLEPRYPRRPAPAIRLRRMFARYWRRCGRGGRSARLAAWRAVEHNHWGAAAALRVWSRRGAQAREDGERRLAELLRHPERISEQLVTIRAVQTLAVLDVLNYREHVYHTGRYEEDGELAADLLRWAGTAECEETSPAAKPQGKAT